MQPGCFLRSIPAALLGLGVMTGLLRAADALPLPNPPPNTPQHIGQPALGDPAMSSNDVVLPGAKIAVEGPRRPIRNYFIANVPAFCWAHHNGLGCGNFLSEFNFLFGSCRTFYGEPCLREPSPQPVPVGYQYGAGGYGPGGTGGCRCP